MEWGDLMVHPTLRESGGLMVPLVSSLPYGLMDRGPGLDTLRAPCNVLATWVLVLVPDLDQWASSNSPCALRVPPTRWGLCDLKAPVQCALMGRCSLVPGLTYPTREGAHSMRRPLANRAQSDLLPSTTSSHP